MKSKIKFSTVPYENGLKLRLGDPSYAVEYLKGCIEGSAADMPEVVLSALKNVADIHGMTWLAKQTKIPRQTLYQMLSKEGNPSIRAFISIIHNLGLRITFEPEKQKMQRRASGG